MHYIDTHNHFAWDIDDGMPNIDDAKVALANAKLDGVNTIIATPHFVPGNFTKEDHQEINNRIDKLRKLAETYEIDIYTGSEVFLNSSYLDMIDNGLFNTLADSSYILVEFDVRRDIKNNHEVEDILYELTVRELNPIIAHAERYFHTGIDLKRVQSWIDMGCYIQVNRTSILGMHGDICEKNAYKLMHNGLAQMVASDAHRSTGNRICKMSDVYQVLVDKYGQDNAILLCYDNPAHIIQNEELEIMKVIKKKSLLDRLRGK